MTTLRTAIRRIAPLSVLALSAPHATLAGTPRVWDGGGGNTLWTNAVNWTDDDVPDSPSEDAQVDGNTGVTSAPVYTMPAGAAVTNGSLTVDAGDSVTINKVTLSGGSNASMTFTGALENRGTVTTGGTTGSSSTHGNNFTVVVQGGGSGTFNHAGATLTAKSLTGYRRTTSSFYLPANTMNDGNASVQCLTGEGGGIMRFRLTGTSSATFVNNGQFAIEGRGYSSGGNAPWCVVGPDSANLNLTIGGTGTVVLASGLSTRTDSFAILTGHAAGCTLTNGPSHTIRGAGYINRGGNNGGASGSTTVSALTAVVNAGLVIAEPTTSVSNLFVSASGGSTVNLVGARMVSTGINMQMKIGSDATAGTFLNDGVLEARSGSTVAFASNVVATLCGELRGAGTFSTPSTITVGAATLAPGNSANADGTGASTVGALSVSGNLVLSSTTTLSMQLGNDGVAGADYDTVNVSGNLTLDGTLSVDALGGYGTGVYRLFTCAPGGLTDNGMTSVLGAVIVADVVAGTVDLVVANAGTTVLVR